MLRAARPWPSGSRLKLGCREAARLCGGTAFEEMEPGAAWEAEQMGGKTSEAESKIHWQ